MPKLVVNLAIIVCEAGTKASTFQSSNAATVTASPGLMAASMNDFAVGVNIDTFGTCRADPKKKPCKPVTPFPWFPSVVHLPLLGQPAITDASQLTCVKFGTKKIFVVNAGQVTVEYHDESTNKDLLHGLFGAIGSAAGAVWDSRHDLLSAGSVIPEYGTIPGVLDQALYYGEGIVAKYNGDQVAANESLCKGNYAGASAISSAVGGKALKSAGVPILDQAVVGVAKGFLDSMASNENCE